MLGYQYRRIIVLEQVALYAVIVWYDHSSLVGVISDYKFPDKPEQLKEKTTSSLLLHAHIKQPSLNQCTIQHCQNPHRHAKLVMSATVYQENNMSPVTVFNASFSPKQFA